MRITDIGPADRRRHALLVLHQFNEACLALEALDMGVIDGLTTQDGADALLFLCERADGLDEIINRQDAYRRGINPTEKEQVR